jgi:hypothetical protein
MRFNLGPERAEKKAGRRRPAGSSGEDAFSGTAFIAPHNASRKCKIALHNEWAFKFDWQAVEFAGLGTR